MSQDRFITRHTQNNVNPLFVERWSPRQYSNSPVKQDDLATIFDAARLSPSCFNAQPWHFISCTEKSHSEFLDLLIEGNQAWAKTAPIIGFIVFNKHFEHNNKSNIHASFDTGAAWMALSLQASLLGYYAHGMGGIKYEDVYNKFAINPDKQTVICAFTLGKIENNNEENITTRKPLESIWQHY